MITVKMLAHKNQDIYSISSRSEGIKFFKDISKDGVIKDPIEVEKGILFNKSEVTEEDDTVKVSMVMSDSSIDRDEERILTEGWDLKSYLDNPVLLWSHDRTRPAIGYMENLTTSKILKGTAAFVPKAVDHFGWSIGQKVSLGILRAGSVGFNPLEWKFIDDPKDSAWLEFSKQELWEFSICNVPANPRALVQNSVIDSPFKRLDTIEEQLRELTNLLSKEDNKTIERKNVYDVLSRVATSVQGLHS